MNIIPSAGRPDFFAINVFATRPETQHALVEAIRTAGDATTIPGLLSMHLLRSEDGTQVTNHMHWASKEAFTTATATNPVIRATRTAVHNLVEGAGPRPHEVIEIKPRS